MHIKEAKIEDAKFYVEHSERLFATNGQDGILFSPREAGSYKANEEDIKAVANRWSKKPNELGFEKSWLVWDENKVVGHILVRGQRPESQSHRVELGMGLETHCRREGLGKKLVTVATDWVRNNTTIEWIDLAVFAQNKPAVNLYLNFGFQEVGRVTDRFRVAGISVDNIDMVLKLQK